MYRLQYYILTAPLMLFSLAADVLSDSAEIKRWYSQQQVEAGKLLFGEHCAICHGKRAEGNANWKTRLPDGSLPPPPLNGTAHTWHHQLPVLRRAITLGGQRYGGKMPDFGGKLKQHQVDSIIAWLQSLWSNEVYAMWSGHDIEKLEQPEILKNLLDGL